MIRRRIPGTDLTVSAACLGTMTFGTPVGEAEAIALLRHALARGIDFIDTANMYEGYARVVGSPGGVAERIVGAAIAGNRSAWIVATKVGMKVGPAPEDEGTSAAAIRKHLPLSLARLGVESIDVYYLHRPDPAARTEDSLAELSRAMRAGMIRHYGVSNYSAAELGALLAAADANGLPRPVLCQPPLSLLKRDSLADLLPLCAREGIGVVPYQVLQGGLLTGKYRRGAAPPPGSRKAEKPAWVWDLTDDLLARIEGLEAEGLREGLPLARYAVRWALRQPGVVSALVGVKSAAQLEEAVDAVDGADDRP